MKRDKSQGLTLIEIMIVVVLMLSLVISVLVSGRHGAVRADTSSFSKRIASALQAARQQAMAEGQPVALVFPSENGTRPHSQSYYLVTGHNPVISSSVFLGGEHKTICAAIGILYPGSVVDRSLQVTNSESFDLKNWLGASGLEEDFLFCFTPDGSVLSNDLPMHDDTYHILVSSGLEFSATGAPSGTGWGLSPQYFAPIEVSSARVVSITKTGQINESAFVPTGAIREVDGLAFGSAPATAPNPTVSTVTAPTLTDIEVFPVPDPTTVPPGIEALVDVDGHLTLSVLAKDADPERQIYCTWESDNGGPFSKPDAHNMEWDQNAEGPGLGGWISRVDWRPPPGTVDGDEFVLTARVTDSKGGMDSSQIGVTGRVLAVDDDVIVFQSNRGGLNSLYTMLPDGSDIQRVGDPGDRIGYLSDNGKALLYANGNSIYMRVLGGPPIFLLNQPPLTTGGPYTFPADVRPSGFNRDGTLIFWTRGNEAYTARLNGNSPVTPHRLNDDTGYQAGSTFALKNITLSPDGTKLAYQEGGAMWVADFDENAPLGGPYLTGGPAPTRAITEVTTSSIGEPHWAPDGAKLYYHYTTPGGQIDAGRADFNPTSNTLTNIENLTNTATGEESGPVVSPDGTEIMYTRLVGGSTDIFKANSDGSNPINLTNTPGSDEYFPMWSR